VEAAVLILQILNDYDKIKYLESPHEPEQDKALIENE